MQDCCEKTRGFIHIQGRVMGNTENQLRDENGGFRRSIGYFGYGYFFGKISGEK